MVTLDTPIQQYEFDQDEEIRVSHAKIPAGSMKLLSKLKEYQIGFLKLACWGDSMLTSLKSQCMTLQSHIQKMHRDA